MLQSVLSFCQSCWIIVLNITSCSSSDLLLLQKLWNISLKNKKSVSQKTSCSFFWKSVIVHLLDKPRRFSSSSIEADFSEDSQYDHQKIRIISIEGWLEPQNQNVITQHIILNILNYQNNPWIYCYPLKGIPTNCIFNIHSKHNNQCITQN